MLKLLLLFIFLFLLESTEAKLPRYLLKNSPKCSGSPFYNSERLITLQVKNLTYKNKEKKAFELLKKVISVEKSWRMKLCQNVFGTGPCERHSIDAQAFFIWKKAIIHFLTKDPTKEITDRIWANINKTK